MALLNKRSDELDRLFDVLGHPARRRILALLVEAVGRGTEELSPEALVPAGADSERAPLELYHTHLPKLDEAGYVRWRPEVGSVGRGPRLAEAEAVVQLLYDRRDELPGEWS